MPASPPSSLQEFEENLVAGIDPVAVPSVAYGVMRGDETLLFGAAGIADKERGLTATTRTSYSLASITKPMTTMAVRLLEQRGLVDLDAPIDLYLGEAKLTERAGFPRLATVRRVADHTAGLPLHYQFYYADEPLRRSPFDETVRRYGKTFTAPGERHQYSNLGYGMLDALVERVSGVPYARFMQDEVFGPLGMRNSAIDPPAGSEVAIAYGPDGVGYPFYDFDHPGGSAAYTSVEDLLAFGRFHLGGGPPLLPIDIRREMHVPTAIDVHRQYGFGWAVQPELHGLRCFGHTGGMGGVRTILRLVPELDLTIAILVNGESELPFTAADDAVAALHPEFRERLAAHRAEEKPETAVVPVSAEWHGTWHGRIETHEGDRELTLEIRSGEEAVARLDEQESPVEELQLRSGRLLGVFDGDVRTEDASRRPYRIHLDLGRRENGLDGAAVTVSKAPAGEGGAPGKRLGNALAYWTELIPA